jgi:hypothetical protein
MQSNHTNTDSFSSGQFIDFLVGDIPSFSLLSSVDLSSASYHPLRTYEKLQIIKNGKWMN